MSQPPPKGEFTDVDGASDPRYYVSCLDAQHAMGFFQAYKQRTFALLSIHPGTRVLDVGCGTYRTLQPRRHALHYSGHQTLDIGAQR